MIDAENAPVEAQFGQGVRDQAGADAIGSLPVDDDSGRSGR
jgi:hypothetical protein